MKKINLFALVGILILLAFLIGILFVKGCDRRKMKRTGNHSRKSASITVPAPIALDTQRVEQIEPITPSLPVIVPIQTKLQTKLDLPRRKQLEKNSNIIVSIRKDENSISVQTISPKGIVMENTYPEVYAVGKFEIDSTGQLRIEPQEYALAQRKAKRKKTWRKVWNTTKTVVIAGVVGWLGVQVGKAL